MKLLKYEAVSFVPGLYTTFAIGQRRATHDFRYYEGLQK